MSLVLNRRENTKLSLMKISKGTNQVTLAMPPTSAFYFIIYFFRFAVNPLYTGGLFYCYMLDESIIILWVSSPFCRFYFISDGKSCF